MEVYAKEFGTDGSDELPHDVLRSRLIKGEYRLFIAIKEDLFEKIGSIMAGYIVIGNYFANQVVQLEYFYVRQECRGGLGGLMMTWLCDLLEKELQAEEFLEMEFAAKQKTSGKEKEKKKDKVNEKGLRMDRRYAKKIKMNKKTKKKHQQVDALEQHQQQLQTYQKKVLPTVLTLECQPTLVRYYQRNGFFDTGLLPQMLSIGYDEEDTGPEKKQILKPFYFMYRPLKSGATFTKDFFARAYPALLEKNHL